MLLEAAGHPCFGCFSEGFCVVCWRPIGVGAKEDARLFRERVPTAALKQSVLPKSSLVPGGGYHSQKLGAPCGACWGCVGLGAAAPFLQVPGMEVQSFAGG